MKKLPGIRFIPACAGNSFRSVSVCFCVAVHPRVCGEQTGHTSGLSFAAGSSPRVRGTGERQAAIVARIRFIPACAGNRPTPSPRAPLPPVHPRVCGEQLRVIYMRNYDDGSSPRVRGTENAHRQYRAPRRFIPACAGNRLCT